MAKKFKIKRKNTKEGKYHTKNMDTTLPATIKKQSFKNTSSIITDNEYEVTSEIDKEAYK